MHKLNDQQLALIAAPINTKVVGVAGAGTGKTTTILERTKRVLQAYDTGKILLITFTRAAANDIRVRIAEEVDDEKDTRRVIVGTFHSIIGNIIRRNATDVGLDSNFTIIDEKSTKIMYRNIVESNDDFYNRVMDFVLAPDETKSGKEKKLMKKHYNAVASIVSVMVNAAHPEELMTGEFSDETKAKVQKSHYTLFDWNIDTVIKLMYEIFTASVKDGHRTNTVTYDHILFIGYLLVRNGSVTEFINNLVHTIVDEYQDTNMLQDAFIEHIAGEKLTIVGDVDQSIYEFRGGKPSLITDHAKDAQVYNLSYNYRSFQNILDVANNVIANNQTGADIRDGLRAMRDKNQEDNVHLIASETDALESQNIIERIENLHHQEDVPYNDMAIMIRSRMSLPSISRELSKSQIPVNDTTQYADFMKSQVVTDILNYFKVFSNPRDVYAFLGIVNTPKRGIGPAKIDIFQENAEKHNLSVVEYLLSSHIKELTPALHNKIEDFVNTYQDIIGLNDDDDFGLTDLFDYIVRAFGYEAWIDSQKDNSKLKRDLTTLRGIIVEFEEAHEKENDSASTLYDIVNDFVFEMTATTREESVEGVVLTTVHNAKGLEWGHVFVIGLEDENFPGTKMQDNGDLESERRLMYVSLTRAKDALYLYVCKDRITTKNELTPSRFVGELNVPVTSVLTADEG